MCTMSGVLCVYVFVEYYKVQSRKQLDVMTFVLIKMSNGL